ncbi:hypothetical protein TWF730_010501 [Orbilia blumenaviensis]|uniref:Uncharacterized protein n=1 Tax=Orbilia blumenaviensis TaxID=1796055 RepID=A0AAV9UNV1_9PEZI
MRTLLTAAQVISLCFLEIILHLIPASAYEIGFIGYIEYPSLGLRSDHIDWVAVPPNSDPAICHHISPTWAGNVEYVFVKTTPMEEPVPLFIGLYGNNDRPNAGCIYSNLQIIIKWQPELIRQMQMANALNRNLNRWAVLIPNTNRTEMVDGVLGILENGYAGGHVAWRPSGWWEVDSDVNRVFNLDEIPEVFPTEDEFIDSDFESDYNYHVENANAEVVQNGPASPARTVSTEGSEQFDDQDINAPAQNIERPVSAMDRYRDLFQQLVDGVGLGVDLGAGIEALISLGADINIANPRPPRANLNPDNPILEANAAGEGGPVFRAMRELTDYSQDDWPWSPSDVPDESE